MHCEILPAEHASSNPIASGRNFAKLGCRRWAFACGFCLIAAAALVAALWQPAHAQAILGSIPEEFRGRLVLAGEHQRRGDLQVGRIDVEADDLFELGRELQIIRQLEPADQMRPQAMSTPDPLHRN